MSNNDNIYNILNNFNKVVQEAKPAVTEQKPVTQKTKLEESMEQISEKYMGFKKTVAAIKKGGSAENPEAVAAAIGRKKYGKEKFQQAAAAGKKLGEEQQDESALQAYLGKKKYGEEGMKALQKAGRDGASKETMAKIRAKHDKMDEAAKPDYIDLDKDGDKKEPMKKAAKDAKEKKVKEGAMPASVIAAKEKIRKMSPEEKKEYFKGKSKEQLKQMARRHGYGQDSDVYSKHASEKVDEVAPPGAKAERMVKHVKKGYAKDGKLTPKEKSIAYATAWKAHNKGKVDETIRSLLAAGYSKEQIVEGWEDMIRANQERAEKEKQEKGTGKFDKKQTSTGTVYTRKYDPKSGETDDTGKDGEGQQVKRGRGRPRKSTFESFATANKMIADSLKSLIEGSVQGGVWTSNPPKKGQPNVPVPQDIDGRSVTPAASKPVVPATPAQKPLTIPPQYKYDPKAKVMPSDPEGVKEDDMEEGNAFGAAIAKAKADGVQPGEKINVGGKEYAVKEDEELNQMRRIAGLQECGPMGMGAGYGQESQGKMNISTNMSSDGTKSVTISADGEAAAELLQMLKLAGMGGHTEEPEATLVVAQDEQPEEVEEEKDERYYASTTPDEEVAPVQAQTKGGDGDVAGQEKTMRKNGYQFGDNNLAMREVAAEGIQNLDTMGRKLMKEYESIKVKK